MKIMNSKKPNIIFVLPSLAAGGAERVMSYIAQHINNQKYNVTLVVFGFEKDKAFEVKNINIIYLNKPRVATGLIDCIFLFKRLKPEIVISVLRRRRGARPRFETNCAYGRDVPHRARQPNRESAHDCRQSR